PKAQISYVSLVPRPAVTSPRLAPRKSSPLRVPLLELHIKLVEAYWSTREPWKPWIWLEEDFRTLRQHGFRFNRGSITTYREVVELVAGQFACAVESLAIRSRVDAIVVYGRGHWTMNAAA